jgi:hypothetical protein
MARIKVNATLAKYVIADLSGRLRLQFKYPDRLTNMEATKLLGLMVNSTEMRKAIATVESTPEGKNAVRLYREVLQHFALEHKADANGEPVPFDKPAFSGSGDPSNPFKGMDREHAQTVIEWAKTQPDYHAITRDKGHLHHEAVQQQIAQLYEAAYDEPATAPAAPVSQGEQPQVMSEIARITKTEAYLAKAHPDHAATVQLVQSLYQQAYPQSGATLDVAAASPAAPAPGRPAPAAPAHTPAAGAAPAGGPDATIARLSGNPALFKKGHPDHAAVVAEWTAAHEAKFSPSPSVAGGQHMNTASDSAASLPR